MTDWTIASVWLLKRGAWDDEGDWLDTETWIETEMWSDLDDEEDPSEG